MIVNIAKNHSPRTRNTAFRNVVSALMIAAAWCTFAVGSMGAQDASSLHQRTETLRQTGLSQAAGGHIDEAIETFNKGLAIEPANAALLDAAGAAYSIKGELETARKYFVESLAANPDSVSTRQNLGIVQFSLGNVDDAARQFTKLREVPGKPRAVASLFLGLIAQRHSGCEKAIALLEGSGELLYQYPDALLSYAQCEYELGNSARAKQVLAAFDQSSTSSPAQHQQVATLYARLGLKDKAQEDQAKAQASAKHGTNSILERAAVLEKAQRLEEAQAILQNEAAASPTFDVLYELAEVAKQRGDYGTAMKSLKQASEIEPDQEESYLEFSSICADHGNDQLALDSAEIGLDHVPNSYQLTVQKGVVQEKLGHLNEAEETLRKAAGMQADNSIALVSLAVVQAHAGRPGEAEDTLTTTIRQFPDNYYMHYFRGKLLLQVGNTTTGLAERREAARRSLEKAIQLNPKYADSYYQLSDAYMDTSPKLAEQALQKCLQLDPAHIPAQYALARLFVRTGRRAESEKLFARIKGQQRAEELKQQKQLRIEVAQN